MPQLVGLMLLGAGLYAGFRALKRSANRLAEDFRRAEAERLRRAETESRLAEKDLGRLELDPASGVYKPTGRS
jgi:hypothetical protein